MDDHVVTARIAAAMAALILGLAFGAACEEKPAGPAPAIGEPAAAAADSYSMVPSGETYAERRAAYLAQAAEGQGRGPYNAAARLALGKPPLEGQIEDALDHVKARRDCSDFRIHGLLRLLYQFSDSPLWDDPLKASVRECVLSFKYWPDEPGIDSMCYWSENHFILYASAGYLAGQLYPDETFTNSSQTGREKIAITRPRILRWLDLRFKTGFSEWLSNVYYEEDLAALLNLVDFCQDPEIRQRATMVTDLLLADIALNTFHGAFGSTHGRSYEHGKKWAQGESTASVCRLLFGLNRFQGGDMAAVSIALSQNYRMPRVLYDIATDIDRPEVINKQRAGIRLTDAPQYGLNYHRLEDGMTFLTMEAYSNPKTVNLFVRMLNEYNWWENSFFAPFKAHRQLIETAYQFQALPLLVWLFRHDVQRNQRDEANIYTYRTPDYMLSTAQDYRPGYGGDQQHVWQATLGPGAVCFTTHPARRSGETPNYWAGSGTLPRVAQIKNVAIAVYKVSTAKGLYVTNEFEFTHAWFPKDQFDEVIERDGWYLARRGDAYLALWSRQPCHWQTEEGEDKDRELIAPGKKNVWICELGSRSANGDFGAFVERIVQAEVRCADLQVTYVSPSQGQLEFGWRGPLRQQQNTIALGRYPRYDNTYVHADFPASGMTFHCNDQSLELDWAGLRREASAYCGE